MVKAINYHYSPIYGSTGQTGSLPNATEIGYTSNSDNLIIDFAPLRAEYMAVVDTNADGVFNNQDTATYGKQPASIATAVERVVDRLDLLLCSGSLKARYGSNPDTPRKVLLDALNSIRASSNSTTPGRPPR